MFLLYFHSFMWKGTLLHLYFIKQKCSKAIKTTTSIIPTEPLHLNNDTYELLAMTSHLGTSPNFGHYISYTRMEDNWNKCDDSQINIVDKSELTSSDSYLLVYKKVNNTDHSIEFS